jgi:hypothetical protein
VQVLANSMQTGTESDPTPGEGPLPIEIVGGTFDLHVPPAVDLSCVDTMDWPVLIGDFMAQLINTGVVDVDMRPLDLGESLDPYKMVVISAVSAFGEDRRSTVHFDYFNGSYNASAARYVEDFTTINNKLYDYLGPRNPSTVDADQWRANITPTVAPPALATRIGDSRTKYGGEFMSIRVFDSVGTESSSRPLYLALWEAEQSYRVEPRDMLFITPAPGDKALFQAGIDFDVGDLILVNTGTDFGIHLSSAQRIYGYDVTWDRQGVRRVSELITSADAE